MLYNFDEIIDRNGTSCLKHDAKKRYFGTDDILSMWVADMDFRTPDVIVNALRKRLEHEILGYPVKSEGFNKSVVHWMQRRFQWNIQPEWISFTPGVVSALNFGVLAFSNPGDKVMIQSPVYAPFFRSVNSHQRELVVNELKLVNNRYVMDLEHLESQIDKNTKVLLFCSPHNPAGRVWTKAELLALGDICIKHNLIIISDEIHSDIIMPGHTHTPLASLSKQLADITVTCMSPSKTFNIAGLATSVAITSNPELKKRFEALPYGLDLGNGNLFGLEALEAAYTHGEEWLSQMIGYVGGNIDLVDKFISQNIPKIKVIRPEGTYLVWLDCRALGMNDSDLRKFFVQNAKLGFNNGTDYGQGGSGFMRMNVGCPRSIVMAALQRLKISINALH